MWRHIKGKSSYSIPVLLRIATTDTKATAYGNFALDMRRFGRNQYPDRKAGNMFLKDVFAYYFNGGILGFRCRIMLRNRFRNFWLIFW